MKKIMELRDKRGKCIADARAILDRADAEKRDLTNEENAAYDALLSDADKVRKAIEREEHQALLEKEAAKVIIDNDDDSHRKPVTGKEKAAKLYSEAFYALIVDGVKGLSPEHAKALTTDTDTDGGYLVMPEQWVNRLIKGMDNVTMMRQFGTVFSLNKAVSLGAPSLDTDIADADWTTELGTGSLDTSMAFGKRTLTPHPFAKRVKISNHLLRNSAIPVDTLVLDRLSYKAGITEEQAFMTGNGAGKPLGIFTASDQGISTSRDVSTDNAATYPTFDGLVNAKYALKSQYWTRARWVFHRDCMKAVVKLKDGDGQYIWRDSVSSGEPDTLLGRPVYLSEYAPNTMTTALYVGVLGDFSYYWIADALSVQVQVLKELYAESNQTGIIMRKETDGMPVLEEAFVRVKLG